MNHKDTIIALATASGVGAIAVLRLSGPDAIQLVSDNFQSVKSNKSLLNQKSHTLH